MKITQLINSIICKNKILKKERNFSWVKQYFRYSPSNDWESCSLPFSHTWIQHFPDWTHFGILQPIPPLTVKTHCLCFSNYLAKVIKTGQCSKLKRIIIKSTRVLFLISVTILLISNYMSCFCFYFYSLKILLWINSPSVCVKLSLIPIYDGSTART